MSENHEVFARIVTDLVSRGATEVDINDKGLRVVMARGAEQKAPTSTGSPLIVNFSNVQSNMTDVNLHSELDILTTSLLSEVHDPAKHQQASALLPALAAELAQPHPKWDKIKPALKWVADFGRDAFLKLLPLILKVGNRID